MEWKQEVENLNKVITPCECGSNDPDFGLWNAYWTQDEEDRPENPYVVE